ncbi:MAG: murein biosynthesis integral membrane protein MurJ [Parcubacteria group bacterium]|nr:murein biosynthesis integral membrane protein MurJ [Parcubacteria group bacterium]
MVTKLKDLLYGETSGLLEAAFLLGGFALFSKLLALVRDRLLAGNFGAGLELDIYYAAFRVPDFVFISLASLVASAVLIPFFVERLGDKEDAERFFNSIFTVFFLAITVVSAILFVAMPRLAPLVVPGFDPASEETMILLSRIMLLSPILLGLSGLFASVTQALRRFFIYALTPVVYNLGIILGILFLYPTFGMPGLAYGVVLGSLLHFAIQLPVLARNGFLPRFSFGLRFAELERVLALSLPRTITLSANHLVILIFIAMASLVAEGSIAVFNLSYNLQSVPLSVIGISYSVAAFPTLAYLLSNGKRTAFVSQILTAARHIIFWSIPITVLFIVLRAQIVRTIFGTGEFGWAETRLTAAALALFALSVAAQSLLLLFVRGYYAAGYTKKPLFVNVISAVGTVLLGSFLFSLFSSSETFKYFIETVLRVEGLEGTSILMLPLAFSIGQILNLVALWIFFSRDFDAPFKEVWLTLRHSFYGAVAMGFVSFESLRVFDDVFDLNTLFGIFSQGFLSGLIGILAGILLLLLLGNQEVKEIGKALHGKFWRGKPIAPDQGEL